jgi:hypothetical protein
LVEACCIIGLTRVLRGEVIENGCLPLGLVELPKVVGILHGLNDLAAVYYLDMARDTAVYILLMMLVPHNVFIIV